MKKILCFIVILTVIMSCFIISVSASTVAPYVSNSSIDYGFLNYSVPYLETLGGDVCGYAHSFAPLFYQSTLPIDVTSQTENYYSYSASGIMYLDGEQHFPANTSYLSVMSINFSKPVYKATFRFYLGEGASFDSFTFSSFGGDNLSQWTEKIQSNYAVVSIYNIEHPVKLFYRFKTKYKLSCIGFNISLATLIYQDGTAEQFANDNANTDKITSNNNANTDKITSNNNANTDKITNNNNANTDKITNNNNANTDKITNNQNQNTQDIIDNQNQLQENEKTEANSTGNGGVNSLISSIPTDSAGVLSAFKSLTDSMTTTDLTCKLNFAGITIPAIDNFFGDVVLLEPCDINLRDYISMIPYKLLLLVQSLSTIALIVFCFKELYSIVSYVLTLRGGGSE